jgi:branched-chain amino acid transport system permease protein
VARTLLRPRVVFLALALALLGVFPYLYNWPPFDRFLIEFRTFQATRFAIWLIILMGLNLLTGYSGQISLGHAALVAIGAYIAAILMKDYNTPVFAAVLAAGILTGMIGFLIGIPALRLSGPYLAIATLALIIVLPQVLKHPLIDQWTGGVMGISLRTPHAPTSLNNMVTDDQWLYYCCMVPAILMTSMAWSLTRSRLGRAFVALRDSEIGAQQMGINVALYKMTAFGISSLFAGVGGALYIYTTPYLGPATFDILLSLTMLIMIVLGGLASIVGTVFAAIIMSLRLDIVDWIIRIIPQGDRLGVDASRGAIFGILLIISIIFTPRGVAGNIEKMKEENTGAKIAALFSRLRRRSNRKGAEAIHD